MKTDTQQQTNHTPGPWIVEDDKHEDCMLTIRSATARLGVAYCVKDDARLIAAAPDLLDALRGLLSRSKQLDQSATHDGLQNCQAIKNARIAIEKAEGRA